MPDIDPDEPLFYLSEEQLKSMTYAQAQAEFNRTTFVSDEVRTQCVKELAEAKKHGYKV